MLNTATVDAALTALRAVVDHRDNLVKTRTQTINRLHGVLTNLVPGGAKTDLTAERAAAILRSIRPRDGAAKALRALAVDLIDEVRQLDRRIAKAAQGIQSAVTVSKTTLTQLYGVGTITAAKILSRVGDVTVTRFRSAAAFATYTGTAPIEVSSADVVRHRLSRAGDRQLNSCLHVMALVQIRNKTEGRAYFLRTRRRQKQERSHAMPQTPPIRRGLPPTNPRPRPATGRLGRTFGDGSIVSRGRLTPRTPTLQTSHFPSLHTTPYKPTPRQLDTERRHYRIRSLLSTAAHSTNSSMHSESRRAGKPCATGL